MPKGSVYFKGTKEIMRSSLFYSLDIVQFQFNLLTMTLMLEEDAVVIASGRWGAKQGFTAYPHSESLISKLDEYQHLPYWRVAMKT